MRKRITLLGFALMAVVSCVAAPQAFVRQEFVAVDFLRCVTLERSLPTQPHELFREPFTLCRMSETNDQVRYVYLPVGITAPCRLPTIERRRKRSMLRILFRPLIRPGYSGSL